MKLSFFLKIPNINTARLILGRAYFVARLLLEGSFTAHRTFQARVSLVSNLCTHGLTQPGDGCLAIKHLMFHRPLGELSRLK